MTGSSLNFGRNSSPSTSMYYGLTIRPVRNIVDMNGSTSAPSIWEDCGESTILPTSNLWGVIRDENDNPIPVKTLSISYGTDLSAGFPQTCALTPNVDPAQVSVPENLVPVGTPLSITLDTETEDGVYVALFPINGLTLFFSVHNSTGTSYTGTASATLKAGRFYPATIKLDKV